MAEASIVFEKEKSESESDKSSKKKSTESNKKTPRGKSASKSPKDDVSQLLLLEKKMNDQFEERFSSFDSKIDKLTNLFEQNMERNNRPIFSASKCSDDVQIPSVTVEANSAARRPPLISLENSLDRDFGIGLNDGQSRARLETDQLSVAVSETEKRNCGWFEEDSDRHTITSVDPDPEGNNRSRFSKYMACTEEEKNKSLLNMFGEDAQTKKSKPDVGIVLDDAQMKILSQSYRSENPDKLTCYKDSYRSDFPVHENCESFFQVPKLDDTVESLLIKKYGHKAAFGHSPSLFSKSMRAMERLAFQGQMASRMGMIMCCYSQQILGSLLDCLQQKDCNLDLAVQMTRDVFAISTKTLDQVARTGAFNHLLRRKAALHDTGLNDLKDYSSTINTLPLTAEGVFGSSFDQKLKAKQERNKQITEVLPDSIFRQPKTPTTYKRKFTPSNTDRSAKKPKYEERSYSAPRTNSSNFSAGFRIPRLGYRQGPKPKPSQRSEDARTSSR